MSDIAIKVEDLSKLYRLGEVGTGSLAHDINRWWHRLLRKDDPYAQVGRLNDRTKKGGDGWVWALKEINFEVKQGEVLGIIGRNGAGKSTLLKILSRVTAPTTGAVRVKGRIASLLEVGTGFNPELTGRENIFLNGAILGMSKDEIRNKLEQIVEFSGCEAYLDTPVKRYSSGMQVRLAFAVAAHLEPEILIVDEVLAVGDAEFQKKCVGRMSEVAGEGRTVLFVSHNLTAVRRLCTTGLTLKCGTTTGRMPLDFALSEYASESGYSEWAIDATKLRRSLDWGALARVTRIASESAAPAYASPWSITMTVECAEDITNAVVSIGFNSLDGGRVMTMDSDIQCPTLQLCAGANHVRLTLDHNPLHPGPYSIGCSVWSRGIILDAISSVAQWEVQSAEADRFAHRGFGGCRPSIRIECEKVSA